MPIDPDELPKYDGLRAENREPWDRLTYEGTDRRDESLAAYKAFLDFCTMGRDRTIRKLHQEYVQRADKNRQHEEQDKEPPYEEPPTTKADTLYTWSSRFNWTDRSNAFQEHRDWEQAMEKQEDIEKMQDRHANAARMMQSKLLRAIQETNPGDLTVSQMRRWLKTSVEIERLAHGVNTESIDHQFAEKPDRPTASGPGEKGPDDYDAEEMAEVFQILAEEAPETVDDSDAQDAG